MTDVTDVLDSHLLRLYRDQKEAEAERRARRDDRAQRDSLIEQLENEEKRIREGKRARSLIEKDAGSEPERLEELRSEREELAKAEQRAVEQAAEAEATFNSAGREKAPEYTERAAVALRKEIAAYAELGTKAFEKYLGDVVETREERRARLHELRTLLGLIDERSGRPVRELRSHLRGEMKEVPAEAAIGYAIVRVLEVSRTADGPVGDLWAATEAGTRDGSMLNIDRILTSTERYEIGAKGPVSLPLDLNL